MYIGMISTSKHFYPLKAGYRCLPCLSFCGSGHFLTGLGAVFPHLNVLHVIALQADFRADFWADFHIFRTNFHANFPTGSKSAGSKAVSDHVEDLRDLDEDHKYLDKISGSISLLGVKLQLI